MHRYIPIHRLDVLFSASCSSTCEPEYCAPWRAFEAWRCWTEKSNCICHFQLLIRPYRILLKDHILTKRARELSTLPNSKQPRATVLPQRIGRGFDSRFNQGCEMPEATKVEHNDLKKSLEGVGLKSSQMDQSTSNVDFNYPLQSSYKPQGTKLLKITSYVTHHSTR